MRRGRVVWSLAAACLFSAFGSDASAMYNDYGVNQPSAFRDYQQVMIWDSEVHAAVAGLRGVLMFSTGSCFSGGFIDDLVQLDRAVVVTANLWHGFGLSMCDFLTGVSDERAFHDDYLDAFEWDGTGSPPTFEEAFALAKDTLRVTEGQSWSWGGVEFPQFASTGGAGGGDLRYKTGDRAILFSGMPTDNPYYRTSWDYTIAAGRGLLMQDYGWPGEAVKTLFSDGNAPPGEAAPWLSGAGTKSNLLSALREAADDMDAGNSLVVFVIAHGRSSAVMASRLPQDGCSIEYLLIPNGRSIALDPAYPVATYGCSRIELTGFRDLDPRHYSVQLPAALSGWGWRIDPEKGSLFLEADDPADESTWLVPGTEYLIRLEYHGSRGRMAISRGGWILWLPEGGGGPLFMSDYGEPGPGWGIGEHVPGGDALGSPDPSGWGDGWDSGGDGWILVPAPLEVSLKVPALSWWGVSSLGFLMLLVGVRFLLGRRRT